MTGSQLSREYGEKEFESGKDPASLVTGGDTNRSLRESMLEIYWEISEMKISDYDDVINLWRNAGYIHQVQKKSTQSALRPWFHGVQIVLPLGC